MGAPFLIVSTVSRRVGCHTSAPSSGLPRSLALVSKASLVAAFPESNQHTVCLCTKSLRHSWHTAWLGLPYRHEPCKESVDVPLETANAESSSRRRQASCRLRHNQIPRHTTLALVRVAQEDVARPGSPTLPLHLPFFRSASTLGRNMSISQAMSSCATTLEPGQGTQASSPAGVMT